MPDIYDTKLLQLLRHYYQGICVEMFDETSYGELLEEPSSEMKAELEGLAAAAGRVLDSLHCSVALKQFGQLDVPALYVAGANNFLDSTFGNGGFSEFMEGFDLGEFSSGYAAKLYLNSRNPLIRRLAQIQDPVMIVLVRSQDKSESFTGSFWACRKVSSRLCTAVRGACSTFWKRMAD